MTDSERKVRTARDNKRTGLFWGAAIVMLGVAILLHFLIPETFGFWASAGVFLGGTGVIAVILDLTMQNTKGLWFSLALTIAGLLILIGNLCGPKVDALPWILIASAVIIIGVGVIIRYIIKKD